MKTSVLLMAFLPLALFGPLSGPAESQPKPIIAASGPSATAFSQLAEAETVVVPSEPAEGSFVSPLVCDEEGSLYLQTETAGSPLFARSIRRVRY